MARLEGDPVALEMLQAWQAQREALRALHRPLLEEPTPETLLAAARRSQQGRKQVNQWWRWGGMAAAVVLAFGLGWISHVMFQNPAGSRVTLYLGAINRQSFARRNNAQDGR